MTKKTATKSAKTSQSKNSSGSAKINFFRVFRITLLYLLAFYGVHAICADIFPSYKKLVKNNIELVVKSITQGVSNVENELSPLPTITIRTPQDLANTPYDNLTVGVPSFQCDVIVDRAGYALGYSEYYEQPLWVSYKITSEEVVSKKARRSDDFRSDPYIPTGSAALEDYQGSFYDRGHLAPAADMSFSLQAMSESFFMSNMSPQRGEFNRGIWKLMEAKVRDYAEHNGALYVVTGPVFDKNTPCITIGNNKVAVPDGYYKVILDPNPEDPKAIGFIFPHRGSQQPLSAFAVTVDRVEEVTGLDFFAGLDDVDEWRLEQQCDFNRWERSLPEDKRSR